MTSMILFATVLVAQPHINEGGEAERRLHLMLDAAFTYGIGGQSALGGEAHLTGYTAVWNSSRATGSVDVGFQLSYGNEPTALAPWLNGKGVDGSTHRVQMRVSLGHSIHMGAKRRAALGLHLFAGWNHWLSSYAVDYTRENVRGQMSTSRDDFVGGLELKFTYRFSRNVGMNLLAGAPLPYPSSYVVGMFFVGAGLTFYLR